jgi:hypothetical protein
MTVTRYGKKSKLSTMKKFKEIKKLLLSKKRKPTANARSLNVNVSTNYYYIQKLGIASPLRRIERPRN